ncbi:hypothetical protein FRC01_005545 [Tulasnella sp. 417]|nr:hypothetical protein FRC01_005545 [Tulasnella sp. 417]
MQDATEILGSKLTDVYCLHFKKRADYNEADLSNNTQTYQLHIGTRTPVLPLRELSSHLLLLPPFPYDEDLKFKDPLASIEYPDNNYVTREGTAVSSRRVPQLAHPSQRPIKRGNTYAAQISLAKGRQMMMEAKNDFLRSHAVLMGIYSSLQMVYLEQITRALVRFGGQQACCAPPFSLTIYHQRTTNAAFYANTTPAVAPGSQAMDLQLDNNKANRSGYTFYEKDAVSRRFDQLVLNIGGSYYTVQAAIGGQHAGWPTDVRHGQIPQKPTRVD